jgi:hypothetical protein
MGQVQSEPFTIHHRVPDDGMPFFEQDDGSIHSLDDALGEEIKAKVLA